MFPVLLALGPVAFYSLNLFFALGLVFGLFVFWRKGREEHYDEMMLFDGVLLSILFAFVVSRIVFIVLNFNQFGSNLIAWLDIFSVPGFNVGVFFLASGFYVYRYAKRHKWDVFEILDFWSMGAVMAMIFIWVGYLFAGTQFGVETTLPVGIMFPGVFEKHHPVQLYYAIFYALLYLYLAWAEYRYRTFNWYRAGKNTAQTGFLMSIFFLASGLFSLIISPLTISSFWQFQGIRLDVIGACVLTVVGAGMLFTRSGRQIGLLKKKSAATKLEDFHV